MSLSIQEKIEESHSFFTGRCHRQGPNHRHPDHQGLQVLKLLSLVVGLALLWAAYFSSAAPVAEEFVASYDSI